MLLNFSREAVRPGPQVISAADVIGGTVPKSKIAGKIVFVGAIDSTLGDNQLAPVNKSTGIPGVLLHANAANTMLTGTYLEPVSNDRRRCCGSRSITALIGIAVLLLPLWMSVLFTFLVGVGYVVFAFVRFNSGQVLQLRLPVDRGDRRLRRRARACATSARRASADGSPRSSRSTCRRPSRSAWSTRTGRRPAAEGERLDMTVLFCDLRGFTALSESLEPAIVRTMLNHYYDRVTDVVLAHARHPHEVRRRRGVRGVGRAAARAPTTRSGRSSARWRSRRSPPSSTGSWSSRARPRCRSGSA